MIIKVKLEAPQDEKNYEIYANAATFHVLRTLILRTQKRHQKNVMENVLNAVGLNIDFAKIGVNLIDRVLKQKHAAMELGEHRYALTLIDGVKKTGGDTEERPRYKVH
jgi:hypothetical protein